MEKVKIGFDPTGMWDKRDYRLLIDNMIKDEDVDLYLVTDNPDSAFIADVVKESGIDSNTNVFQETNDVTLTARLTTEGINIFLAKDMPLVDFVNANAPINLEPNNVYGCQAIPTTDNMDRYYLQFRYVTHLQFWISQVQKYNTALDGQSC